MFYIHRHFVEEGSRYTLDDVLAKESSSLKYTRCAHCLLAYADIQISFFCDICTKNQDDNASFIPCISCMKKLKEKEQTDSWFSLCETLSTHEQKHAKSIRGESGGYCVDAHMYDLLETLNENGYETDTSCEGDAAHLHGRSYLGFADVEKGVWLYANFLAWVWENDIELDVKSAPSNNNPLTKFEIQVSPSASGERNNRGEHIPELAVIWLIGYYDVQKVNRSLVEYFTVNQGL